MREFFGFFRYVVLPGVYHLLFMLTLPIALMLIWGNEVFVGAIFFIFGAPLFRGLRERSINKREIRSREWFEKQYRKRATQQNQDLIQFNEDYPMQVLVFPWVSEINEHLDENEKLVVNEQTERWVRLCFDEELKNWLLS